MEGHATTCYLEEFLQVILRSVSWMHLATSFLHFDSSFPSKTALPPTKAEKELTEHLQVYVTASFSD